MSKTKSYTIDSAPDEAHEALRHTLAGVSSLDLVTGGAAVRALVSAIPLGVRVPDTVHESARRVAVIRERLAAVHDDAVAEFTPDDLTADDWQDRLERAAALAVRQPVAGRMAEEAKRAATSKLGAACVHALDEVGDELERWFLDNLDDLARADLEPEPGDTYGSVSGRNAALLAFRHAHAHLMAAGGGTETQDYAARTWWTTHTWTREEWTALVDATGPNTEHRGPNPLALAVRIGATPRLARSFSQPWEERKALHDGEQIEKRHRAFDEGRTVVIGAAW